MTEIVKSLLEPLPQRRRSRLQLQLLSDHESKPNDRDGDAANWAAIEQMRKRLEERHEREEIERRERETREELERQRNKGN